MMLTLRGVGHRIAEDSLPVGRKGGWEQRKADYYPKAKVLGHLAEKLRDTVYSTSTIQQFSQRAAVPAKEDVAAIESVVNRLRLLSRHPDRSVVRGEAMCVIRELEVLKRQMVAAAELPSCPVTIAIKAAEGVPLHVLFKECLAAKQMDEVRSLMPVLMREAPRLAGEFDRIALSSDAAMQRLIVSEWMNAYAESTQNGDTEANPLWLACFFHDITEELLEGLVDHSVSYATYQRFRNEIIQSGLPHAEEVVASLDGYYPKWFKQMIVSTSEQEVLELIPALMNMKPHHTDALYDIVSELDQIGCARISHDWVAILIDPKNNAAGINPLWLAYYMVPLEQSIIKYFIDAHISPKQYLMWRDGMVCSGVSDAAKTVGYWDYLFLKIQLTRRQGVKEFDLTYLTAFYSEAKADLMDLALRKHQWTLCDAMLTAGWEAQRRHTSYGAAFDKDFINADFKVVKYLMSRNVDPGGTLVNNGTFLENIKKVFTFWYKNASQKRSKIDRLNSIAALSTRFIAWAQAKVDEAEKEDTLHDHQARKRINSCNSTLRDLCHRLENAKRVLSAEDFSYLRNRTDLLKGDGSAERR